MARRRGVSGFTPIAGRWALIALAVVVGASSPEARDRAESDRSWEASREARQAREAERRRVEQMRRAYEFRRAIAPRADALGAGRLGRAAGVESTGSRSDVPGPVGSRSPPGVSAPGAPVARAGVPPIKRFAAANRALGIFCVEAQQPRFRQKRFPGHGLDRARGLDRGARLRRRVGVFVDRVRPHGTAVPVGV